MSQDQPEVHSSGVPVLMPCVEVDRWVKNEREMMSLSQDMPWNPYKALLHTMLPSGNGPSQAIEPTPPLRTTFRFFVSKFTIRVARPPSAPHPRAGPLVLLCWRTTPLARLQYCCFETHCTRPTADRRRLMEVGN